MNNEVFFRLIYLALTLIAGLVSAFVVPALRSWIQTKVTAEQMSQLEDIIEKSVRRCEQAYTPEEWAEKKQWVITYITDVINDKFSLNLTYRDVDTMIEGIVHEVKKG